MTPPNPLAPLLLRGINSQGPQGPMYGNAVASLANQAQTAPPNAPANVVAGIADFLTNYQRGRREAREQARTDFMSGIQLIMLGLPVNHKKMAKNAKLAGLDLDFEGDNTVNTMQAQRNAEIQQLQGQALNQNWGDIQASMLPNAPPDTGASQLNSFLRLTGRSSGEPVQQAPLPGPTPGPRPGLLSRIGQGLGVTAGPINPNSPGMAWLAQLAQTGQETARLSREEQRQTGQMQQVRAGMLDLLAKAIGGDANALELVTRLPEPYGLKSMPFDGLLQLGRLTGQSDAATGKAVLFHALGGQQALQHIQTLAKDLSPHFGNDLGKAMQHVMETVSTGYSSVKPQMSMEEQLKIQDAADRLAAKYPTAPMNMIMTYANLLAAGNKSASGAILDYLSNKYKREGTISGEQFDTTNKWHRDEMAQAAWIHGESMDLARKKALLDAAGDEGKRAWELINGKDSTAETKEAGYKLLAESLQRAAQVDITFNDYKGKKKTVPFGTGGITEENVRTLFHPFTGVPTLQMTSPGKGLEQFVGQPPAGGQGTIGRAMEGIRKYVEEQFLAPLVGQTAEPEI